MLLGEILADGRAALDRLAAAAVVPDNVF